MNKAYLYSLLLILGIFSSLLHLYISPWLDFIMLFCMSYIMIEVGNNFDFPKISSKEALKDNFVAWSTATAPWMLCACYFFWVVGLVSWKDAFSVSRFASPTSTALLLSLCISAGLRETWFFTKARTLAVFDDLYTILLIILSELFFVGYTSQLLFMIFIISFLVGTAWYYSKQLKIPTRWPWLICYSFMITVFCEYLNRSQIGIGKIIPASLEVFLVAFVLGCLLKRPIGVDLDSLAINNRTADSLAEAIMTTIVSIFIFIVGFSIPDISFEQIDWSTTLFHVFAITILSNLGKMTPLLFYKKDASWRENLALAIAMCIRGESAGRKIMMSIQYGNNEIGIFIASLALIVNLLLTAPFVAVVKKLVKKG